MRSLTIRGRAAAAAALGALLVGGGAVAYSATTAPTASCTANPTITDGATSQSFQVSCSVPKAAAIAATQTTTITQTATVTVTASPTSTTRSPTTSPATAACDFKPSTGNVGAYGTRSAAAGSSITAAGTVISGRSYPGDLTVYAANVTLDNVSVGGKLLFSGSANGHVNKVTAQEIHFSSSDGFIVENSQISGSVEDAIHVTSDNTSLPKMSNGTVKYSFVGAPGSGLPGSAHFDAIQLRGITTFTAHCNAFDVGASRVQDNSLVYAEQGNGGETNVYVTNNWLTGSAWTFMLGAPTGTGNYQLTGNTITQVTSPSGPPAGGWGICSNQSTYKPTLSGNTYNGAPVAPCQ